MECKSCADHCGNNRLPNREYLISHNHRLSRGQWNQHFWVCHQNIRLQLISSLRWWVRFLNFFVYLFYLGQIYLLTQWFPTGVPRQTRVPWRGARGAQLLHFSEVLTYVLSRGVAKLYHNPVSVPRDKKGWETLCYHIGTYYWRKKSKQTY